MVHRRHSDPSVDLSLLLLATLASEQKEFHPVFERHVQIALYTNTTIVSVFNKAERKHQWRVGTLITSIYKNRIEISPCLKMLFVTFSSKIFMFSQNIALLACDLFNH